MITEISSFGGEGTSTQQRIMDSLRRKGQDPWINPATGNITTMPRSGPGSQGGAGDELAREVSSQRADSDAALKAQREQALLALQKGLMSEDQYQAMMTNLQVSVEQGTERAAREQTESAYGQTNIGQVKAQAADIRQGGREILARGRRDIDIKREEMKADVGRQEAELISRQEIPKLEVPSTFTEEQTLTAIRPPMAVTPQPVPVAIRQPRYLNGKRML